MQSARGSPTPSTGRRRALGWAVGLLFLGLIAEGGARAYWHTRGVPFRAAPQELYRSFYPELSELDRYRAARDPKYAAVDARTFEVLLLGGSVLHNRYGDVEHVLRERLVRATRGPVHIANMAQPGHTMRDSLAKYRRLAAHRFDLVIVYHGINDARANNCRPEVYRDDYGHMSWYQLLNAAESGSERRLLVTPYTVRYVATKLAERKGWGDGITAHRVDPRWRDFGSEVKTVTAFERNVEGLVSLAAERKQRLLLMTFAHHSPPDYSEAAFLAGGLDFTTHLLPTELWGAPANVIAALEQHNDVIRRVAAAREVALVDQEALIPRSGVYFNDICHLTHEGSERLVENLLPAALEGWTPR